MLVSSGRCKAPNVGSINGLTCLVRPATRQMRWAARTNSLNALRFDDKCKSKANYDNLKARGLIRLALQIQAYAKREVHE
eukprot:5667419-Pleurochrysis_carterae.AAC.1